MTWRMKSKSSQQTRVSSSPASRGGNFQWVTRNNDGVRPVGAQMPRGREHAASRAAGPAGMMLRICSPAQRYVWSAQPAVPSGSHCQLDVGLQGIKLTYNALIGQVAAPSLGRVLLQALTRACRESPFAAIERSARPSGQGRGSQAEAGRRRGGAPQCGLWSC